jgi:hypothetical protein
MLTVDHEDGSSDVGDVGIRQSLPGRQTWQESLTTRIRAALTQIGRDVWLVQIALTVASQRELFGPSPSLAPAMGP